MVGFLANDVLEGLCFHGTFHRVIVGEGGDRFIDSSSEVLSHGGGRLVSIESDHRAGGIAEIPFEAIHAGIDMAGSAGNLAEARGEVGVVNESAAVFDGERSGIVKGRGRDLAFGLGVDDGEGG